MALTGVKVENSVPQSRQTWAQLAQHTFQLDVLRCAQCGFSPIRVVEIVVAPTREQLATAHGFGKPPAPGNVPGSIQPRAPPSPANCQLELPFMQRAA